MVELCSTKINLSLLQFFVGDGDPASPWLDLSILARSNHTIMTRGAFSAWAATLAGGECYTEVGSRVGAGGEFKGERTDVGLKQGDQMSL
jgi:hypothetical protein